MRDGSPGAPGITAGVAGCGAVGASYDWIGRLTGSGGDRYEAIERLHALLLRASRAQLGRMNEAGRLGQARCDEIVQASTDEAVVAVLARLSSFQGRSQFTTWAYKFAILHTATAVRREAWRDQHFDLAGIPELPARTAGPADAAEAAALSNAIRRCVTECLTPHQRRVLVTIVIEGMPIDVVADRLGTTRNAVYKTLHDARKRLRECLAARGFLEPAGPEEVNR